MKKHEIEEIEIRKFGDNYAVNVYYDKDRWGFILSEHGMRNLYRQAEEVCLKQLEVC